MAPVLLAVVAADAVVSCRKGCEDVFLCVAYVLVVDVQCAALVAHGCLFAAGDAFDFDFHIVKNSFIYEGSLWVWVLRDPLPKSLPT